jgi:dGTPase
LYYRHVSPNQYAYQLSSFNPINNIMLGHNNTLSLFTLLDILNRDEEKRLSPSATASIKALRRKEETLRGHRQNFALDADRILHSRAYTRYIDKTQVFYLVANDHITHRVLHVQLVSRIARTIGRFLFLNEDLIEAIALGHDIGHPPFGHDGEKFLSDLCTQHGLPPFQHNIQSVRFLDCLEKKGVGWNLTLQTLDGILCHDGESHNQALSPEPGWNFADLDKKIAAKEKNPSLALVPMTFEGCVVRLADTVAYIGRDIEDAIILGIIKRSDLPKHCVSVLGDTNGSIVYSLVTDLILNSKVTPPASTSQTDDDYIGFSSDVSSALEELKKFNYQHIYLNPLAKQSTLLIKDCYEKLFRSSLRHLMENTDTSSTRTNLIKGGLQGNIEPPAAFVRDFIAGMTDDFFLQQAAAIGCIIPKKQ